MKLQSYTLKNLAITLLLVIPVWAGIFYALILDEVHDNIDDDLKNSKIIIIRNAFANKKLLNTPEFGINKFTIKPLPKGQYNQKDVLITTEEFMEYDNDNQPIRILKTIFKDDDNNAYELTIKASIVEEDELLQDLFLALVGLYVMLVISILAVNKLILKRIWKSFHIILDNLKIIKLGTGTNLNPINSNIDEFNVLEKEIENMLNRNETIYNSQKQFIENAAHELQTPLAISINKLELFAESSVFTEEQMVEIGKITDTLSRLTRLNKSLLLLTKIENQQFPDEEILNFNDLISELATSFEDLAEFKCVKISIINNAILHFKMNRGLAIALISNLLKNAIIHNHQNGTVNFEINANNLIISNTGFNYPLNSDLIYNRFYRHTTTNESTGLGLSIVKSILTNYNISISYSFDHIHHFKLDFLVPS